MNQIIAAITAIVITTGTKTPAILSAILAIGALLEPASSTRRIIWLMVVSSPTLDARIFKKPFWLMVAEIAVSPTSLYTGMLSPVMADSSRLDCPSSITPSTGTVSPGRTNTKSPFTSSSTGTITSLPSLKTFACFGAKSISFSIASLVFPLERLSKYFPTVINVRIIPADSK